MPQVLNPFQAIQPYPAAACISGGLPVLVADQVGIGYAGAGRLRFYVTGITVAGAFWCIPFR